MDESLKQWAKEVAEKEVRARVRTLDQAKEDYRNWIETGIKIGGYELEVIKFWNEVLRNVHNVKGIEVGELKSWGMEDILEDNGFDFEKFKLESEYSAKNILLAMQAYADQEAKRFGSYISNVVVGGKSVWAHYEEYKKKTAQ